MGSCSQVAGILLLAALVMACQPPGSDASWATRPGDRRLSADELTKLVVGQSVRFEDQSQAMLRADRTYILTDSDGSTYPARWDMTPDGVLCLRFPRGGARCDVFVRNGAALALISRRGRRLAVTGIGPG